MRYSTSDSETQVATQRGSERWLRRGAATMLVLLLAQFVIGMLVNLFVVLPSAHPGSNAPEYFSGVGQGVLWGLVHGAWQLQGHVLLGVALGLLSVALLVGAIIARRRVWIVVTILGWLGVFGAGFNGASFMNYGHDFSSLIMTVAFLLALIAYSVGFYLTKPSA